MFEKILKNSNSIKEIGFEYYNIQEAYDVSINFIRQGTKVLPRTPMTRKFIIPKLSY